MATFRGTLEVEGDPASSLVTDVDVSEGRISMKAGGSEIGSWDLNDISIEESEGAFRIIAEDESLLLRLRDAKRFAGTVGVSMSPAVSGDLPTSIVPTPTKRAPDDMPLVVDEPISQPLPDSVPAHVPQASREGPDETPLARHLSWSLVGVGALLFLERYSIGEPSGSRTTTFRSPGSLSCWRASLPLPPRTWAWHSRNGGTLRS